MVANTVAALTDIHTAASAAGSTNEAFIITPSVLTKLLVALNECSEWGRVAILNALSRYEAQDERESEHICERVVPQFQHANASVVLAAVKVDGKMLFFVHVYPSLTLTSGCHDPHARCPLRKSHQADDPQNGPTFGHSIIQPA